MMRRWIGPLLGVGVTVLASAALAAAALPPTWDGLVNVPSSSLGAVYLLPKADFRPYTKVMIDPPLVAFQKDWVRNYNADTFDLSRMISKSDTDRISKQVREGFAKILDRAYADAGYQVVTTPDKDVMRLSTAVINLAVTAPDILSAGASVTWSVDAGSATVVIEARDSATNALLGRAVDSRVAGGRTPVPRSSVTNASDFAILFKGWAMTAVGGLARLKTLSPVDVAGQTAAK